MVFESGSLIAARSLHMPLVQLKNLKSWQLLPCASALYKHCEFANYQTCVWKRSMERPPAIASLFGNGWEKENTDGMEQLVIDWADVPAAPEAVLLSCTCTRSCKSPTCPCIENGLQCTELCKLQTCTILIKFRRKQ